VRGEPAAVARAIEVLKAGVMALGYQYDIKP
jgi:hypothetical protein